MVMLLCKVSFECIGSENYEQRMMLVNADESTSRRVKEKSLFAGVVAEQNGTT
jgi:hypothetical protein